MAANSKIGWTDDTFNLWWGCTHDGPECDHCYAETWAKRTGFDIWGHDKPRRFFGDKHWRELDKFERLAKESGRKRRVFLISMGDIAERLPGETGERMQAERDRLWAFAEQSKYLQFQVLTKRPQNLPGMVPKHWLEAWPEHVWVGATAGDQDGLLKRGKYLARIPAPVRFLSCEPLLGHIAIPHEYFTWLRWVIIGGESGGNARLFRVDAASSLVDQCERFGVAVFTKQFGRKPGYSAGGLLQLAHPKGEDSDEWPGGPWPKEFPA